MLPTDTSPTGTSSSLSLLDRTRRLQEFTAALSGSISPVEVAQVFSNQGISGAGAVAGSVFELTNERMLRRIGTAGYNPLTAQGWGLFSVDVPSPISDSVRTGEAIWIESVEDWYKRYPNVGISSQDDTAWAALPLITSGTTLGCITLTFRRDQPPSDDDKAFVAALTFQCAQALDRAQLYIAEQQARALAELERARAASVLENINDAFVAFDHDWRFTYVNRKAEQIMRRNRDTLLGLVLAEVFPDPPYAYLQRLNEAVIQQRTIEYELYEPILELWLFVRVYPTSEGVTVYFQDVTERKRTEQALTASQNRFTRFMESNLLGIIFASSEGAIIDANNAFLNMIGYSRVELENGAIRWAELTPPEYLAADARAMSEAQSRGSGGIPLEKEFFRKDGSRVPVLIGGVADGDMWITFVLDLTESKRAEKALRHSESRFNHFMDSNVMGIIIGNNAGDILEANDAFLATIGYTRDDLNAGRVRWTDMTPPEYAARDRQAIEEALTTSSTGNYEKEYFRKDGSRVPILLGGMLIDGIWTSFVIDLTELKRAERGLRLLTEASALLASSLDYEITLTQLAGLVVPGFADWCTIHIMQPDATLKQVVIAHKDPAKVRWADEIQREYPANPDASQGLYQVIRTGQSEFYPEISEAMLIAAARDARQLQLLHEIGYTAAMIVPLTIRGRTLGAIQFVSTESRQRYIESDLKLAEDLAHRAAVAVDNANLYSQMRDQRERLQVTLSSIGDAVIATDHAARITFINPVALELTGWTLDTAIGADLSTVFRIINATTRQTVEGPVDRVLREGIIVGLANHTLLLARDGREIPIDDSGAPIRTEDGNVAGVILVFRDVTDQKRAETEQAFLLEASLTLASSALDYAKTLRNITQLMVPTLADWCAIYLVQPDGSIQIAAGLHVDPAKTQAMTDMMQRYPWRSDAAIGLGEVIRTGQSRLYTEIPDDALVSLAYDETNLQQLRAMNFKSSLALPLIVGGRTLGALALTRFEPRVPYDPADLALGEEAARRVAIALDNTQLYQQAQSAVAERDEFLSVAAHELKTPITSLRGFTQLLTRQLNKRGSVDPAQLKTALEVIDKQSVKLTQLIGQLLDVARFESGRLVLEPQTIDLSQLVTDIGASLQRNTQQHTIRVRAPESFALEADPLRLEQVLINLIDNAIKYSPQGGDIEIDLEVRDTPMLRLSVTDHGIGIPVERRAQIFDRFYQAHRDGYLGGMGLGLYISRQIVELHNGQISAEFPDEGGTRFVVQLPFARNGSKQG